MSDMNKHKFFVGSLFVQSILKMNTKVEGKKIQRKQSSSLGYCLLWLGILTWKLEIMVTFFMIFGNIE